MNDWKIQSRAHRCQACQQPFVDKQLFHTLLFDRHPSYLRWDLCDACWQAESKSERRERGFVSYWQNLYEPPPTNAPDPIQRDTAETLLRRLVELQNPKFAAAGYILAVMLERKRLLRVKDQFRQDARRFFVYEHPETGDVFTIPDPALRLGQLEEVQRTVADLLQFGLNASGELAIPAPPAPDPSAADALTAGTAPENEPAVALDQPEDTLASS